MAGKVGVTTGRLATAGVSTMPRLLGVDTNEGVVWVAAGNALGIELTRGIAAIGEVVGFKPAGAAATGVADGAGLLASNELGSGGTGAMDDEVAGAAGVDAAIDDAACDGAACDDAACDGDELDSDGRGVGATAAV